MDYTNTATFCVCVINLYFYGYAGILINVAKVIDVSILQAGIVRITLEIWICILVRLVPGQTKAQFRFPLLTSLSVPDLGSITRCCFLDI